MKRVQNVPKERFLFLGERDGSIAYFDEYHLQTILPPPFLSRIKTDFGRRWVLRNSNQSRSSDTGVRRKMILLARAKTKRQALTESAKYLGWKSARFDQNGVLRGYVWCE